MNKISLNFKSVMGLPGFAAVIVALFWAGIYLLLYSIDKLGAGAVLKTGGQAINLNTTACLAKFPPAGQAMIDLILIAISFGVTTYYLLRQ